MATPEYEYKYEDKIWYHKCSTDKPWESMTPQQVGDKLWELVNEISKEHVVTQIRPLRKTP